ncbi:putative oxidoreductase [Chaetomium strumarium]|uniref:Oxidoreductase n=1 Tax=Chaetomium strumarium TaxID=1170767 RepID=A0AAJ0GQ08_9PEZI|nr:putative oxidoreductase [Chaetomium strumarium]
MPNSPNVCCRTLQKLLGIRTVHQPGSEGHTSCVSSYWAQQQQQAEQPACVVTPRSAEDVSTAVRCILDCLGLCWDDPVEAATCRFAIRSGGHLPVTGAASQAGGVVLDLRLLNAIEVSSDKRTVRIGAGATWGDVYAKLDPLGLSVAGGRAPQVGVGGLTTGGGYSFMSPRYGWTCDTVASFQVVLANGSIVEANADENADLWWALRGGGNNFGVVTAVTMETFEQGEMWGGNVYYPLSTIDDQLKAFANFSSADGYDENASLITTFGYAAGQGSAIANNIEYIKAEENPAVFAPFMKIPSFFNNMRLDSVPNICHGQGALSKQNMRQLFATVTHASTLPMLQSTYTHWSNSLPAVENVPGMIWSVSLEPLPPAMYLRAARSAPPGGWGKNCMGLDAANNNHNSINKTTDKALVIALLTATWADAADDEKVEKAARELMDGIERDAKAQGAWHPFVYLNYAAPWQDPIASYGEEAVRRLKEVRKRVDPKGVFTKLVPGGFKIPGTMEQE